MGDKQIQEVKQKIQELINQTVEKNERQKQSLSFLFKKLEAVKELELLEKLKDYKHGNYLKAFLFYQAIKRANFQTEHLELTKLDSVEKCLEVIQRDVEEFEKGQPVEIQEPPIIPQLTNRQLLIQLGERIKTDQIRTSWRESGEVCDSLSVIEAGEEIMSLNLETGEI